MCRISVFVLDYYTTTFEASCLCCECVVSVCTCAFVAGMCSFHWLTLFRCCEDLRLVFKSRRGSIFYDLGGCLGVEIPGRFTYRLAVLPSDLVVVLNLIFTALIHKVFFPSVAWPCVE